jgi:hypothetical protein
MRERREKGERGEKEREREREREGKRERKRKVRRETPQILLVPPPLISPSLSF